MVTAFTKDHEFLGVEFDWVAADAAGRVGYFSTAGVGAIPTICLANTVLFEELFERVMAMPVMSHATQVNAFEKNASDWIEISRRGLYSFDWSRDLLAYQLIAIPDNPLFVSLLKNNMLDAFSKVKLDCVFEDRSGNEELLTFC